MSKSVVCTTRCLRHRQTATGAAQKWALGLVLVCLLALQPGVAAGQGTGSGLVIAEVMITPDPPLRGAPATLQVRLENRGSGERQFRLQADLDYALPGRLSPEIEQVPADPVPASLKVRWPQRVIAPGAQVTETLELLVPDMNFGTLSLLLELVDMANLDSQVVNFSTDPVAVKGKGRIPWSLFWALLAAGFLLAALACWPMRRAWAAMAGRRAARPAAVLVYLIMGVIGAAFCFSIYSDLRVWLEYRGSSCQVIERIVRLSSVTKLGPSAGGTENATALYRALLSLRLSRPDGDLPVVHGDGDAGRESNAAFEKMQQRAGGWQPGAVLDCWYDPKDPRSVLLSRHAELGIYAYLALWWGLLFLMASIVGSAASASRPPPVRS